MELARVPPRATADPAAPDAQRATAARAAACTAAAPPAPANDNAGTVEVGAAIQRGPGSLADQLARAVQQRRAIPTRTGRRLIQRNGPSTQAVGPAIGSLQGDAEHPDVRKLVDALTQLVAPGGRTRKQLAMVGQLVNTLPPAVQLRHAAVLQPLVDAVALEMRSVDMLALVPRPANINDALTPYQATNNCALTAVGAIIGKTAGEVAASVPGSIKPDDKFFSTSFLQSIGGQEKADWDARLDKAKREGTDEHELGNAQFEGMRRMLEAHVNDLDLAMEVRTSKDDMTLDKCTAEMHSYPLGTRFAFKYRGHWNYAVLGDDGKITFHDFQQDHPKATGIDPPVTLDPKALSGSAVPILPMIMSDNPVEMLDFWCDMPVFAYIALVPTASTRVAALELPTPTRYRSMKQHARTPGHHGQLSSSKYTKAVGRFNEYVRKGEWKKARKAVEGIHKRLLEMAAKKGYWVSSEAKDAYFQPILDEVTDLKSRVERASEA